MTVSKDQIKKILATLPIGYYAKRNIDVSLVDEDTSSYYVPTDDKIVISYSQLSKALDALTDDCDPANIETDIRTMLYHEVSHAILTPRNMFPNYQRNVVEDERIETVFKKFYMNVDFKSFVKRINGYHGEKATSADEAFYYLVRFRVGSADWLKKLHDLLSKYATLNSNSDAYFYSFDIDNFYRDFVNDYEKSIDDHKDSKDSKKNFEDDSPKSSDDHSEPDCDDKDETTDDSETSDDSENTKTTDDSESTKTTDDSEIDAISASTTAENDEEDVDKDIYKTAADVFAKCINKMVNKDMIQKVNQVFSKATNSTKRNGSSINAYSGVFDPRSVVRDDYKYFTQKNRMGHLKTHSKIHLNLYIDRSASFRSSENIVNQLLYALKSFEKLNPDFTFDLVTIGMSEILHKKDNRKIRCNGGNCVSKKIWDIVKQLQLPSAVNYNIVLFDGDAFTDSDYVYQDQKNFGAFNKSNFTIISDPSNHVVIQQQCPAAKAIITYRYASELQINVFKALDQLVR